MKLVTTIENATAITSENIVALTLNSLITQNIIAENNPERTVYARLDLAPTPTLS